MAKTTKTMSESVKGIFESGQVSSSEHYRNLLKRKAHIGGFHIEGKETMTEDHSYVMKVIATQAKDLQAAIADDPEIDESVKLELAKLVSIKNLITGIAGMTGEGTIPGNNLKDYLTREGWELTVTVAKNGTVTLAFNYEGLKGIKDRLKDATDEAQIDSLSNLIKKATKKFTFENSATFDVEPEKDAKFKTKNLYEQRGLKHLIEKTNDRVFVDFEIERGILFIGFTAIESNKEHRTRADWRYEFYD